MVYSPKHPIKDNFDSINIRVLVFSSVTDLRILWVFRFMVYEVQPVILTIVVFVSNRTKPNRSEVD